LLTARFKDLHIENSRYNKCINWCFVHLWLLSTT